VPRRGAAEHVFFLCHRTLHIGSARNIGIGHVEDCKALTVLGRQGTGHLAPVAGKHLDLEADCHFQVGDEAYDPLTDCYRSEKTRLLLAQDGRVYLDSRRPRVCIRGPEDRSSHDLGYGWLSDDEVFPFLEMRASAQDLRGGPPFSEAEARRRIVAQFDTLEDNGMRHVVLGAFGCGAFKNPTDRIAGIYRDEILRRTGHFGVIAFAIFHAGYGPNNFGPFKEALGDLR
jgi:hypothetical protein